MGMCLEEFGRISIEVRRESFVIHADDKAWAPNCDMPIADRHPHPEFRLKDLDDLIKALEDARDYLKRRKK